MKTAFLSLVAVLAGFGAAGADGTVNFNNDFGTGNSPFYGPDPNHPDRSTVGNTSFGSPAGTQSYNGSPLAGAGFRAELFYASGPSQPESALQTVGTTTVLGTGGYVVAATNNLVGVAPGATATIQVRAWDNSSGLYPNWASAFGP